MILRKFLSRTLAASVLAVVCWTFGGTAWALSLGRATVQSSLGQSLSAEIEVAIATEAEAESLTVGMANAQTYAAANLDYSPALKGLKISLQNRGVGNTVIRIVGEQPLNEPVLQLLLEVRWGTGKMVRSFPLFVDPPQAGGQSAPATNATVVPIPAAVVVAEKIPALPPSEAPQDTRSASETPKSGSTASPAKTLPSADAGRRSSAVVRKGQTTRQFAAGINAKGASIDQVMLALLHANPDAYVAGNINRLKAGAELTLDPLPDAQSLSSAEAAREVARQAAAYAAWHKGIAPADSSGHAKKTGEGGEGRSTNKKVGAAPSVAKPEAGKDELKLGAAKEKDKAEAEKLAAEMQAKEDAERKAELSKNIEALKETAAKTSAASGSTDAAAGAKEAQAPKEPAVPEVAAKVPAVPPPAAALSPWEDFKQTLASLDHMSLAGLGGAAVLLLLLVAYRKRGDPVKPMAGDPEAAPTADRDAKPEGDLPDQQQDPAAQGAFSDPFTQWQDTTLNQATPQSVLFADSQLKPSDSLDAVAEADVYLAYGRDVQAEEILREALGVTPNKVELHQKLLDIFVLRGDGDAFAQVAQTMSTYLDSQGPQWLRVCELGALLDGKNPLYHNHANPGSLDGGTPAPHAASVSPIPLVFPAGLDLNLSKPVDTPEGTVAPASQDFRPSTQVQPLGFEFSSQNLMLAPDGKTPLDTAQPWSADAMDEGSRLLDQKIELAKEFISVGDVAGARILLNEVIERAQGSQLEQAKQLLAQIG
jgi:pilus assembly protein FimV